MEQDARAWQTVEPDAPEPSYGLPPRSWRARAPIESVRGRASRAWARCKEDRAENEAEDTANLALAQGDFAAAERATSIGTPRA